jgi:branched-subunit amino acid aminotransferase/4-amino-4-deoxychorismate lyase
VSSGTVVSAAADAGVLPGIVRARVLALCAEAGVRTVARSPSLRELRGADEVFVTSSLRGVVPVTRLDGETLRRGSLTARLASAYAGVMRVLP